jgi:hypothetical protein
MRLRWSVYWLCLVSLAACRGSGRQGTDFSWRPIDGARLIDQGHRHDLGIQPGEAGHSQTTFTFTGAPATFVVPAGVTSLTVEAWGASGSGPSGGKGGRAKAALTVSPGQSLHVHVGGQGSIVDVVSGTPSAPGAGGWNGGGSGGGTDKSCTVYGGGGASDVRASPYTLADRLIVAAGGGGQGSTAPSSCGTSGAGGAGGSPGGSGGAGSGTSTASAEGAPGGGATASAGGAAGAAGQYVVGTTYPGYAGAAGTLGQGADATAAWFCGAGGGGGGYYGGGSGGAPSANGGGGGSSWATSTATGATFTTGVQSGHGKVVIGW